jgi:prevent-host-death family protein
MESMGLREFEAACAEVVEKVRRTGRPVLITRSGEPVAEIIPHPSSPIRTRRWLGSLRESGKIVGDIVSPASDEADWDALRT